MSSLLRAGRIRCVVAFSLLLLITSAVPVLAAEPSTGASESTLSAEAALQPEIPDGDDIREAFEAAERKDEERKRWLESPEAVAEREESRYAFADLSSAEAKALLPALFSTQFAELNSDPARFLSDAVLVQPLGADERAATVRKEGDGSLLEAGIPVRTENEEGELGKVDLSLEASADGYETTNALSDVHIPDSAAEPIEIGAEGLAIAQDGAEGTRKAHLLGDENVYYHEVLPDVGYMAAPISGGVEVFNFLYSPQSPEVLRYDLTLPPGAELRPDGLGGAEISRGADPLAHIPFPTAVDAQGTQVPVEMEVEGSTLALHVPHRGADFAHPILVDPIVEYFEHSWYWGANTTALDTPGVWQWATNGWHYGSTTCIRAELCAPSGRGLYVSTVSGNLPANNYGQWVYAAPGQTTFIPSVYPDASAGINPFWRHNHNCDYNQYPRPYDYNGLWDGANWNYFETNRALWYGYASMFSKSKMVIFGLSTGNGGYVPCWRSLMVGGVTVRLDDPEAPTLTSVSGVPSGWVSDANSFTITANASDPGLGVYEVTLSPAGRETIKHQLGCTGTATSRCPSSRSEPFALNGNYFDEGEKSVKVAAKDPTGKVSGTYTGTMKVDRTPPEVVLGGQLAVATQETEGDAKDPEKWDELPLPVYNLTIAATDIGPEGDPNAKKRSGVKSIEVFLDSKSTPEKTWTQTCPGSSCSMTQTYTLKLNELSAGVHHTLKVITKDQVNKERKREIEFEYIPATGMKDEYVMHYFPLPDGQGNEAEEEHPKRPELAVNVMNGNLVYREQDIEVEGPAVDLEVERYYNSLLPESENTEWGDGWTLAQTPKLEAEQTEGSTPPAKATMLRTSGVVQSSVSLPTEPQGERFDAELQAVVTKEAGGGYEVADRSGDTANALAFDQSGKVTELRTEGYAKVDYSYEAGKLAEIAVDDPGSAGGGPPGEESGPEEIDDTPTFAGAFGSNGSGDGQLKSPGDVALDAAGNIWVADKGNNRIQKFNPKGEFVSKFGSSGSGDGQLSIPTALAIDAQGNIWVTERGNNRVQKFSPSGEHLAKFGGYGTGNGQFSGPEGITIDPKGNIWISDTYNGRVQKFNSSGEFLKVVGSYGSAPGQIGEATGIDSGPNGTVWIADWQNNRVSAFDEDGEFLFHFGVAGTGNGQFNRPDAIDVDAKGNVWVGDQNNGRVQRFTEAGVYVDQFGSNGSGEGQFSFTYPMGIATNDKGGIWVTDVNNHRVQKWVIPSSVSNYTDVIYADSFGSEGSGQGQLKVPADVAIDAAGNLWVIDRGNDRVQKFSPKGEYLDQFGSSGTGNGQFVWPSGIAIDPDGNIWVTDSANHRVQKFNSKGEYLSKFGSYGAGNGQFNGPAGIAISPTGNAIFVTDRGNHRIQRFTQEGAYFGQKGTFGWQDAQFDEPLALAIGGPAGEFAYTLFVVDAGNNRLQRMTPLGGFLGKFGSYGQGDGQLDSPANVEVDAKGNVWVGDRRNARVQLFDQEGKYIDQFGSKGSEEGQFDLAYPMGIASDGAGGIWVTDGNHNRLQKWVAGSYVPDEKELPDDDPAVQVAVSSGLVTEVKGAEAGQHVYQRSGALLSAHEGPQGKASYAYDSAGRLTKVTLPNGTWGSITYNATYGRVSSVTVDPAGSDPAKTTYFEFSDEPRRTTVIPPDAPHVTYDIGADGSVLKWWNTPTPPSIDDLSGSLYAGRGTLIATGTHNLVAQAHSEEGIASIHFIANGNQLIDEMTCEQDLEKAGLECLTVVNEWVTETGTLSPGILQLEVITTDRLGQTESERFWVNIPYTPPEPPGALTPPKFMDILRFREEYGLEVVFPVANELELNDRIFELIGAWHNPHTPAGEVARASMERWGVPLRPDDVAEMEYREWLYDVNAGRIDQWVEATQPSSYAGYYIDHPAGGIMHVGFLDNQAERLASLKASLSLARIIHQATASNAARGNRA